MSTVVPALSLHRAHLRYGHRTVWSDLDLTVRPGEFVGVVGGNGAGKSSLLRVALGLQRLTCGTVEVAGAPPRRGDPSIGYVGQAGTLAPAAAVRARDLVGLGLHGHRWGPGLPRTGRRRQVDLLLAAVDASHLADQPVHLLSGGEQQRIRIAQALAGDPALLLCDEPLLSLDQAHQQAVAELVHQRRCAHGSAVLFVTHEIAPVLPFLDRVLHLGDAGVRLGAADEILTAAGLLPGRSR